MSLSPVSVVSGIGIYVDPTDPSGLSIVGNGIANRVGSTSQKIFSGTADAKILTDGSVTNNSKTFTSASASFKKSDEGKTILLVGAGAAGVDLATTIASFVSATQVQLTVAASATLTNITWAYGTNNSSGFTAALAFVSGTGATLTITPGQYMFGTSIDFSSFNNLTVSGYGATLIAAIPGAGASSILFYGASSTGSNLTLNANVSANQRTFQMQTGAPLAVGQVIQLTAGEPGSTYTVTGVSGSSPQTVTVDRVILFPYLLSSGARVNVVSNPITNLFIQGLTFIGSCEWFVKIRGVINSLIKDCNFLATISFASAGAFLLSSFSFNWHADNIYVNGPNGGGVAMCEQCWVTRYTFTGTPNSPFSGQQGFQFLECANCGLQDFEINAATANGIVIDQNASAAGIPYDVGVTAKNGFIGGCAGSGITDNGYYTTIDSVLIDNNGSTGITLGSSSENPKISRCRIINNGDVGINSSAGVATGTPATITDCFISNNTFNASTNASGITSISPQLYILGCQIIGMTGVTNSKICIQVSDQGLTFGSQTIIDNCDLLVPGTQLGVAYQQNTNNPVGIISNTRVRCSGGASFVGSGITNLNGKLQLDNVRCDQISGTVGATGLATVAGSLTRINQNCNFDGCTTPISMGGFCNRSINGSTNANSVTLNGTTPVAYGFTDTKSTDRVQLILRTRGATPGNGAVLVAITAGTGITLAGNAAGVNDVYDVVIS